MPPTPKPSVPDTGGRNRPLVVAVAAAAVVAVALIAGSILLTRGGDQATVSPSPNTASGDATPTDTAPTDTAAADAAGRAESVVAGIPQAGTILGSPAATVRVLQFEDLQCPICKRYTSDVFPTIVEEYVKPGRIKIDFRGIAFLGPDSGKALRIAVAAGFQNKLWNVVELLYAEQGDENSGWVTDAKIDDILGRVPGLDRARVKLDAKSAAVTKEIAAVQAEATARKVPGTPWFYIGVGLNQPLEFQPQSLTPGSFRPALDQALRGS